MKKRQALDRRLDNYSSAARSLRAVRSGKAGRGVRYSTAAAAAVALTGAGSAEAALVHSPNEGILFDLNLGTLPGGTLDIDGDGMGPIGGVGEILIGASLFRNFSSSSEFFSLRDVVYMGRQLLLAEPSVDLSLLGFNGAPYLETRTLSGPWTNAPYPPPSFLAYSTRTRTFGFSFIAGSNTSGIPNFGWLQAVIQFGPAYPHVSFPTIVYNTTPGAPVHVGDVPGVPEPSTVGLMGLGLLALGARGLCEQRRRKTQQTTSV